MIPWDPLEMAKRMRRSVEAMKEQGRLAEYEAEQATRALMTLTGVLEDLHDIDGQCIYLALDAWHSIVREAIAKGISEERVTMLETWAKELAIEIKKRVPIFTIDVARQKQPWDLGVGG